MVRVKSVLDPLPLNLDGVPVLWRVAAYMRSLGASPGFCWYQAIQVYEPVQASATSVLVLQFIETDSPILNCFNRGSLSHNLLPTET